MWLFNFLVTGGGVQTGNIFSSEFWSIGICAWFSQLFHRALAGLYQVLGLFADLMHIAFYILAGVDMRAGENEYGIYDIELMSTGDRVNILDYFVFNESVTKAYWILAGLGLLGIVIFTIYKIVKQDYFDRAGPRSKGPIFRNVAISAISFLLVIPIFYVIIHVSSLLAIAVMDAMGMNASTFAGAQIFQLSWSDNGESMRLVNAMLLNGHEQATVPAAEYKPIADAHHFNWMLQLDADTMFILCTGDPKYVDKAPLLVEYLYGNNEFNYAENGLLTDSGINSRDVTFYWYIFVVGAIVAIKSLYTMLQAMLQRIFKLLGLFITAPSPISQYVLDDGAKFKNWLQQAIQEGLRLVVATMSFSIFLMVLNLIKDINFIAPFKSAIEQANTLPEDVRNINVSANLLAYNEEFANVPMLATGEGQGEGFAAGFYSLVNSFLKIFVLMGAGGAIVDLDSVLTPLISGGKSSLDAGQTGKSANAPVDMAKNLAGAAAGAIAGGIKSEIGGAISDAAASKEGKKEGMQKAADELDKKEKESESQSTATETVGGDGGQGGGNGGPSNDEVSNETEEIQAPEVQEENEEQVDETENVESNNNNNDESDPEEESGDGDAEVDKENSEEKVEEASAPEGTGDGKPNNNNNESDSEENSGKVNDKDGDADADKKNSGGSSGSDGDKPKSGTDGTKSKSGDGKDSANKPSEKAQKVSERMQQNKLGQKTKRLGQRIGNWAANTKVGKPIAKAGKALGKLGNKAAKGINKFGHTTGGQILGKAGKLVAGTAKLGGQVAFRTGRGVLGAMGRIIGTAAQMVASEVFGKDAVKAFNETRGDAIKKGQERDKANAGKIKQRSAQKAYAHERKEQLYYANEIAEEKAKEVQTKSEELSNAATAETAAANDLKNANETLAEAQVEATGANAGSDEVLDKALGGDSAVQSAREDNEKAAVEKGEAMAKKEEAQLHQKVIAKSAGVENLNELKAKRKTVDSQISSLQKKAKTGELSAPEAKRLDDLKSQREELKSYSNQWNAQQRIIDKSDKTITDVNKRVEANDKTIKNNSSHNQSVRNLVNGKDGKLSQYGVSGKSYKETIKVLDQKIAAGDTGAAAIKKELESVGGAKVYDDKAVVKARNAHENLSTAKAAQQKAQTTYNNAKENTRTAQSELAGSLSVYEKSSKVVSDLNAATTSRTNKYISGAAKRTASRSERDIQESNVRAQTQTEAALKDSQEAAGTQTNADIKVAASRAIRKNDEELKSAGQTMMDDLKKNKTSINYDDEHKLGGIVDSNGNVDEEKKKKHLSKFGNPQSEEYKKEEEKINGILSDTMTSVQTAKNQTNKQFDRAVAKMKKDKKGNAQAAYSYIESCKKDDGTYDLDKLAARSDDLDAGDRSTIDTYVNKTRSAYAAEAKKNLNKSQATTVGDYIEKKQSEGNKAFMPTKNGKYDVDAMKKEMAKEGISTDGITEQAMEQYGQAKEEHGKVDRAIRVGYSMGGAASKLQSKEVASMQAVTAQYKVVTGEVAQLDKIISGGGAGTISPDTKQLIASTLGIKEKDINHNNVVKYATEAKEVKQTQQADLLRRGEEHSRNSNELKNELSALLQTITQGNNKAQQAPANNTTNINTVNNNNVNNGGNGDNQYWFNGNENEMPASSGLAQSKDLSAFYERMQVEGIKHMENMLSQMMREQKDMSVDVEETRRAVEELKEDK